MRGKLGAAFLPLSCLAGWGAKKNDEGDDEEQMHASYAIVAQVLLQVVAPIVQTRNTIYTSTTVFGSTW